MPLPDVRRSPFTEMGLCKFICHFRDIIVYVSSINKITTEKKQAILLTLKLQTVVFVINHSTNQSVIFIVA